VFQVLPEEIEAERILIQQAQWILDRMDAMNNGMKTRAVSLFGFTIVELSLAGTSLSGIKKNHWGPRWSSFDKWLVLPLGALTLVSLLLSLYFFLLALSVFLNPNLPEVDAMLGLEKYLKDNQIQEKDAAEIRIHLPLRQLLMHEEPESSYGDALVKENRKIGYSYRRGFRTLAASQIFLVALIISLVWR